MFIDSGSYSGMVLTMPSYLIKQSNGHVGDLNEIGVSGNPLDIDPARSVIGILSAKGKKLKKRNLQKEDILMNRVGLEPTRIAPLRDMLRILNVAP